MCWRKKLAFSCWRRRGRGRGANRKRWEGRVCRICKYRGASGKKNASLLLAVGCWTEPERVKKKIQVGFSGMVDGGAGSMQTGGRAGGLVGKALSVFFCRGAGNNPPVTGMSGGVRFSWLVGCRWSFLSLFSSLSLLFYSRWGEVMYCTVIVGRCSARLSFPCRTVGACLRACGRRRWEPLGQVPQRLTVGGGGRRWCVRCVVRCNCGWVSSLD